MMDAVLSDGRYRPGKRTVLEHMNEIAMPVREIGRHVEALNLGEAAYDYRFEKQRRESLANNNPNKKGSIKVQTLRCLECMVTILNEQQKKTGKTNVSDASQFCRRGNDCGRNSAAKYRSYMKLKRERPELLEELQVEASEITPKKL